MKKVDLIIFDIDGTIVDSVKDISNAVNYALRTMGLREKTEKQVKEAVGGGFETTLIKIFGADRYSPEALEALRYYYRKYPAVYSSLYRDVRYVLDYFSEKKKAVVTNKEYDITVEILESLKIAGEFDIILGGNSISRKPDPRAIEYAVKTLKADFRKSIIVGDMDIDIIAGKSAGIMTCAVAYGFGKLQDIVRQKPDFVIDKLADLTKIVY
ncbi:HAD family hydrolase [Elusimicrobiota bacterium]